ncbi:MAG: DUF1015 family protein [Thermoplasmata archaeon]
MTNITGFRGVGYSFNPLDSYLSLPLDEMNEKTIKIYLKKNPYNFSSILMPGKNVNPLDIINKFISNKIFKIDEQDSIYFYEQEFEYGNKRYLRKGYLGTILIDTKKIFPHEKIFEELKINRLNMLLKTGYDLEPIFLIYKNDGKKCFSEEKIDLISWGKDPIGVLNRLYSTEMKYIECDNINFVIADGHHRFEAAKEFSKIEKRARRIMAVFIDLNQDSLFILPSHKLVKNIKINIKDFENYFEIEQITGLKESDKNHIVMNLNEKFFKLKFKEKYQFPLITLFEKIIMKKILKREIDLENVKTFHNTKFEINSKNSAIFYFPPPSPTEVYEFSLKGGIMPQKSTYFFPKISSGIKIYKKY